MTRTGFVVAASAAIFAFSATAANAAITTFAQFTAIGSSANVRWANDGAAKTAAASTTANGTGGYFYTTANGTGTSPQDAPVHFEFLQAQLSGIGPIKANFFMDITVTNAPATASNQFQLEAIPQGSFSFASTQSFTVGAKTYAAGSNLLTGVFTSGALFGTGTSGSFTGNTSHGALVYTSDVLDFSSTINRDYAMSLTSIDPAFLATAGNALRTFRSVATGSFASDPAPLLNSVPEPETWALMVIGFGLVGAEVRRRSRQSALAA